MLIGMECFICGCVAIYLVWRWTVARKRNRASWEQIVSRLNSDWNARLLSVPERSEYSQTGMLARGQRVVTAGRLWAMFSNAGVLVELADYAARNGAREDQAIVDAVRTEATLIRLNILSCIGSYALQAANDRALNYTLRAEQAYAELEVYLTELVEQQVPALIPSLVAAS